MFTSMVSFSFILLKILLHQVEYAIQNFEINILKIEICPTITKKNMMENKFYLLFAGLKYYLCDKLTQLPV